MLTETGRSLAGQDHRPQLANSNHSRNYDGRNSADGCATPGGGCQFSGTPPPSRSHRRKPSRLPSLTPPSALGQPYGSTLHAALPAHLPHDSATTRNLRHITERPITTPGVHAPSEGSTTSVTSRPSAPPQNSKRPTYKDWAQFTRKVPRIVDARPMAPGPLATVQGFIAGAHPRSAGTSAAPASSIPSKNVTGAPSTPRSTGAGQRPRQTLSAKISSDQGRHRPRTNIMSHDRASLQRHHSPVCFPSANFDPEGSVIKSTSIDHKPQ